MAEIFEKRPYDDYPYLVLPVRIFKIKHKFELPTIRAYVYQKDCLFGDPTPLGIAGLTAVFNIYDKDRKIVAAGQAFFSNLEMSEVEYELKALDIKRPGKYYGEFVFKDIDDKRFVLPRLTDKQRILIIVD